MADLAPDFSIFESSRTAAQIKAYCLRLEALHEQCGNALRNHDDDTAWNIFAEIQFSQQQTWLLCLDLFDERPGLSPLLYEQARARFGPDNADAAWIASLIHLVGEGEA